MPSTVTFDDSAVEFVLESFGKSVDEFGYVIDEETGERVTNPDGEEIKASNFAGVEKGSEIFLDDNFLTLVEHVERRSNE